MKMSKGKKVCLAAVILAFAAVWILWGNTALETTEYGIRSERLPEAFSGFRIVQVSDLHNAAFGEDNAALLRQISQAGPDIIVITGDLVDSRRTDTEIALAFARAAAQIAPVYYVSGNHEARIGAYTELKNGLKEAGVTVLENEKVRLQRGQAYITLAGIDDPSFLTSYLFGDDETVVFDALEHLLEASDGYTVLLSHRPELFDTYACAGVDLVFSGHAHGGQFRIPFVGGLVAPDQGIFPKYDAGVYSQGGLRMVVSRGLGNSIIPVRIHNRPELIVVTLETAG